MSIIITEHAPLLSFRLSRTRCSCTCGWQSDWREAITDVRLEWEQHLADENNATRSEIILHPDEAA